jgi:hypothetical protein
VVGVEAWVGSAVPFELLGRLKMSLPPLFQPSDHWLSIPIGLCAFFVGLSTGGFLGVCFPAGISYIFKCLLYIS